MFNKVFKAFAYPDFRVMWFGACTSSIGTWMQILAQSWLVYRLSNSPFYLSLDTFFGQAPIFLFSLFGGVFADRISRRRLLLASQAIQLTCAFTLSFLVKTDLVKVWQSLVPVVHGGLSAIFRRACILRIGSVAGGKRRLAKCHRTQSIQFNLARVVVPALGGIALVKLGAFWCFALNGVSFLAVIGSLLWIHTTFVPAVSQESVMDSMRQGIDFMRKREGMTSLVTLAFFISMLSFPLITFLPVIARDVFHGTSNTFTLFLCLSGAGSVTGALLIAGRSAQNGQALKSLEALAVLGLTIFAVGISRFLALTTAAIFVAGFLLMVVFTLNTSLVQSYVKDAMRGRVMSVYNVAFRGGMPIGSVICGYLIERSSAPVVMAGNGVLIVILALYFLLIQKKLAKL